MTCKDIKSIKKLKNKWLSILHDIGSLGINNLLIEAGPTFINDLFKFNLINEIILFRSNKIIGNDGVPFVNNLNSPVLFLGLLFLKHH